MPLTRRYGKKIKTRQKRRIIRPGRLVLIFLLCLLCGKVLIRRENNSVPATQQASIIPDPDLCKTHGQEMLRHILDDNLNSIIHIVKPGDSFYTICKANNIGQRETALISQLFHKLNVTRLFPGDSMVIMRTADSSFSSIEFFNSPQKRYTIHNTDSCLNGCAEEFPLTISSYLLNGRLETSLSEAVFFHGVGDAVTNAITDIFAWDINFFIDPRNGDSFQIIFEKKTVNGQCTGYGNIIAAKYTLNSGRTFYAFGLPDDDGNLQYYDLDGNSVRKEFLKAPLRYSRISSGYTHHRKHPVLGIVRPHLGVDYAAPYGTPVNAAADGKIIFAGRRGGYGNLVIIAHGGAYQTYYGHLQTFSRNIRKGKHVNQGDIIGTVGATGLATGPHLDYRMLKNGNFINPLQHKSSPAPGIPDDRKTEFFTAREMCRSIFEKRFSGHAGCHLLDISAPSPSRQDTLTITKTSATERNGG